MHSLSRRPHVLCYTYALYDTAPLGERDGVHGKWLTKKLFVPPLALFSSYEEAQAILELELAASF
jgi:hypothetical protein